MLGFNRLTFRATILFPKAKTIAQTKNHFFVGNEKSVMVLQYSAKYFLLKTSGLYNINFNISHFKIFASITFSDTNFP